jgi:hypothetical protein
VFGVKDIPVLGVQADREQPDTQQEQQPGSDGDQHPARRSAAPLFPATGQEVVTLAWHRAQRRAGGLLTRIAGSGSRYGVEHGTDSVRLCQAVDRCLFRQVVAPAGGRLVAVWG